MATKRSALPLSFFHTRDLLVEQGRLVKGGEFQTAFFKTDPEELLKFRKVLSEYTNQLITNPEFDISDFWVEQSQKLAVGYEIAAQQMAITNGNIKRSLRDVGDEYASHGDAIDAIAQKRRGIDLLEKDLIASLY